jgi:putative membrane protein
MYETAKALHVIAVMSWMAGLLYLPRLYVYHSKQAKGSAQSELLKEMERKLLRYIMNPAMIATWGLGIWLIVITGFGGPGTGGWMHAKLVLVLLMSASHGMMASYRKKFANDVNVKSEKYFRIFNEVPTVLMIGIVFLVYLKPF